MGFCSVAPFDEWRGKAYDKLLLRMKHDPKDLMPGARSIVVAVRRYARYGSWPRGSAEVANYYVNSNEGFERVKALAAVLEEAGQQALANPLLPAKQAALRADLGFQGSNTQFCHRSLGMLVSLHLVLTDAELEGEDAPRAQCSGCGLCMAACPSGAISERGFDHDRCLRFHMIDGQVMPLWAREKMGMKLVGCTDCQHACPQARAETVDVPEELARATGLAGLLRGDKDQYDALARLIGPNFARPGRILLQAAVCAGNSGDCAHVPALSALLAHPNPALRRHCAWALGRLGGEEAKRALARARPCERDEDTVRELCEALEALG